MSPRFSWFSCTSTLFEPRVLVKLVPAWRDVGLLDGLKNFETHLGLSEIGYPQSKRHGLSLFYIIFSVVQWPFGAYTAYTPFSDTFFCVCLFVWLQSARDQRPQETVKKLLPGKVSTMKTVGLLDQEWVASGVTPIACWLRAMRNSYDLLSWVDHKVWNLPQDSTKTIKDDSIYIYIINYNYNYN